jgi:hypothetical protein
MKNNLTSISLLEILLITDHIIIYVIVQPRIYLRRNIPVTDGKDLGPTTERIGAEYLNGLLVWSERKKKKGKIENVCLLITLQCTYVA